MATVPGMDLLAQARGGMMGLNGEPGQPPVRIPPPIADFISTYLACWGVVTALYGRSRTGRGQKVDVSLLGGQVATMPNLVTYFAQTGRPDRPMGSAHPQLVPYQPFLASDGYFIAACLTDQMWVGLCEAIGRPELAASPEYGTNSDRVANRGDLIELLASIFVRRSTAQWLELLDRHGVPAGPIHTLSDVLADPQVRVNGYALDIDHPTEGAATIVGPPIHLGESPFELRRHAAALGEHTREVLSEIGYSDEEVDALIEAGVARNSNAEELV
jgi:crotonobetainyl-CoA:carnitine CoA-transferase CaiB-like acyl-CoA transferase